MSDRSRNVRLNVRPSRCIRVVGQDMATYRALAAIMLCGFTSALAQPTANEEPGSGAANDKSKSGSWLFPVDRLNQALPRWLRLGGEYRTRVESEDGIKYTTTNDTYLLSR